MHCRRLHRFINDRGFTLIEVIVSLVLAGILATMLVSFMGSNVVQSANPVIMAKNSAYLNEIMENMTIDYKYQMVTSPTNGLANFKGRVESTSPLYYGSGYTVVTAYTQFPAGNNVSETTPTANTVLKVTVTYKNLTVTALFAG